MHLEPVQPDTPGSTEPDVRMVVRGMQHDILMSCLVLQVTVARQ